MRTGLTGDDSVKFIVQPDNAEDAEFSLLPAGSSLAPREGRFFFLPHAPAMTAVSVSREALFFEFVIFLH
jgi:hypothetical protein